MSFPLTLALSPKGEGNSSLSLRELTRVGKIVIRSAKSRFCSEISDFARGPSGHPNPLLSTPLRCADSKIEILHSSIPTPVSNPSQEGNLLISGDLFPPWEGLGVGKIPHMMRSSKEPSKLYLKASGFLCKLYFSEAQIWLRYI